MTDEELIQAAAAEPKNTPICGARITVTIEGYTPAGGTCISATSRGTSRPDIRNVSEVLLAIGEAALKGYTHEKRRHRKRHRKD